MTAQPEITTAAERAHTTTGTAEAEPLMTFTQLQALLREAAAIERAGRPIVIRPAAEAFPAPVAEQPAPVTAAAVAVVPVPVAEAPPAPVRNPAPAGRGWGLWLVYASITTLLAGAADGIVAGTAPAPVTACAFGIVGIVAGTARAITEQDRAQSGAS
jgi:hypothetical protein